ncbi:iron chelate uptake ABC transporter family permease subunit, partial [Pseudomonas sp.]
ASDLISRAVAFPVETPAGVVTALIGAPFFLFLARRAL